MGFYTLYVRYNPRRGTRKSYEFKTSDGKITRGTMRWFIPSFREKVKAHPGKWYKAQP